HLLLISLFFIGLDSLGQQDVFQKAERPANSPSVNNLVTDQNTSVQTSFENEIKWFGLRTVQTIDEREERQLHFTNARRSTESKLPYFAKTVKLDDGVESVDVKLGEYEVEKLSTEEKNFLSGTSIKNQFKVSVFVKKAAGSKYAVIRVIPFRSIGNDIQRLVGFNLKINSIKTASRGGARSAHSWKPVSVLNDGQWFRLATGEDGIYKVSFNWLRDNGVVPSNGIPSDQLRLFGTGAGMLPFENSKKRPDDLDQISIDVVDGGDGQFGQGDYFLFYGEDQITWKLNEDNRFIHELNAYADSTYYFLNTTGVGANAKRISVSNVAQSPTYFTSTYDYYDVHEQELVNLIGSGRTWYGESLGSVSSKDFGFTIPNIDRSKNFWVRSAYAARSIGVNGLTLTMSMLSQGSVSSKASIKAVADFYGALYADVGELTMSGTPQSSELIVKMQLNNAANPQAMAWIDFIEINARRRLVFNGSFMGVRDRLSNGQGVAEYTVQSNEAITVWDVSDLGEISRPALNGGVVNGFTFKAQAGLREFVLFGESSFKIPSFSGQVNNQNVHGVAGVEYLIVAHPQFKQQAERLIELHNALDGLNGQVVTPAEIYNEFSGGAQDITAIKEFIRKLYFEADSMGLAKPRYLLLFGDASYDYKNRISGNSNFVPTHQMRNSVSPTGSIASDDFYGLLDEDEGEQPGDFVDIGIGRLPARSKKEAEDMVNKIIRYADRSSSLGAWRKIISFAADDADPRDRHTFMNDFEGLGNLIDQRASSFVVQKLYMDSYKQQVGSGGERYPDGAAAIDERVRKGTLMMYFIGHGGELGWAHERILEVPTINKWDNLDRLTLFITATCEFARYDDPRRTSGGEYAILNPSGGAIGLLTTTRAVYSSPNLTLTTAFTTEAFDRPSGDAPRLGDLMLQTKIRTLDTNSSAALNSRSFALLGDPALKLSYPEHNISITSVPDTIKALEKVKIEGIVTDASGVKLEGFNGFVYPEVYDKISDLQTLNNDGSGAFDYQEWKNKMFKGKATVKDGTFSFEFVVPKDIDRSIDFGRVSLYADDGSVDAFGDDRTFAVGGLSDNPIEDDEGPEVDLYMNNTDFVYGGLTNEDPDLYAELRDENGINMAGSGIGHDLTAILDENTSNTLVLNEYYESDVDSYQSGKVRYPFSSLEEGKHSLKMKVWDVNNNPSDAYLEFVVANDEKLALDHVLNYPNPFTTNTDFYFEHNKPGQNLDVRIEVFTVAGKLVKTLDGQFGSNGYRIGPINWNGRDEYGDVIGKGVYLYRVSVKTILGESVEKYERLVLLK
ncbi:MAG: type IX secretion system sortase PorU, partial [Salibacteraceae bacterium]